MAECKHCNGTGETTMIVIEEHRLEFQTGKFKLPVPSDTEVLRLCMVGGQPILVAAVDKDQDVPDEDDRPEFMWLQAGSKRPEELAVYEGTVEDRKGQLWHLFSVDQY